MPPGRGASRPGGEPLQVFVAFFTGSQAIAQPEHRIDALPGNADRLANPAIRPAQIAESQNAVSALRRDAGRLVLDLERSVSQFL